MNANDAGNLLAYIGKLSVSEQQIRIADINVAFDIFWESDPPRKLFCETLTGVILTPSMLYTMVKNNGNH